jgi:antitoxin component of RelBE/YafQ-DinJ toxin-antitoxin module
MAKNDLVQLRCSALEKENWQEAASENGMELSPWIRWVLNKEARRPREQTALFPEPLEREDSEY